MNPVGYRDKEFSFLSNIGGSLQSFVPISYAIGDVLGDLFWGGSILTRRDPLESGIIGGHYNIRPLTFEQMKLIPR
jgi:hypothetical protein